MNAQIFGTLFASAGVISGDVTVEGTFIGNDYLSANWDGAIPVDLSTADATATVGFAWDASLGSVQIMGDYWLGGDLVMIGGGRFGSAVSGPRTEITNSSSAFIRIFTDDSWEDDAAVIWSSAVGTDGTTRQLKLNLTAPTSTGDSNSTFLALFTESENNSTYPPQIQVGYAGGSNKTPEFKLTTGMKLMLEDGTRPLPSLVFNTDPTSGIYLAAFGNPALSAAGLRIMDWRVNSGNPQTRLIDGTAAYPALCWINDADTGMYRIGTNEIGWATQGAIKMALGNGELSTRGGTHFLDYAPASAGTIDAQWFNAGGNIRRLDVVSSMLSGKQDIVPLDEFMDTSKIFDLDLIAFRMKDDADGPMHVGTSAESVGENLPVLAFKNDDGEWNFGAYSRLVVPLIAETAKLRDRVEALETQIKELGNGIH